jgi:MFS family permease
MISAPLDRSYRALLALPSVGRLLVGMQIARIGQSMVSVTIVLFTLTFYRSPKLAGLATFFGIFPGLLVSPIAGALLDRHGRMRLVVLDYVVALVALTLIGCLAFMGALPAWLLIVIAAIASLTTPLSGTGLRSLFPLIIPSHLWERGNAIDSVGFVIATIIGPPLAAGIVALWGGPIAFIIVGLSFGVAAILISRLRDPLGESSVNQPLLVEAWRGLLYTWHNPTLRGLGFSISVANLAGGMFNIVVPLLVLERFQLGETAVGLVIAVQGLAGMISALFIGRKDSRDRERVMLAVPMAGIGIAMAMLLLKSNILVLLIVMVITGMLNGPLDIALFTLRQRRTDPRWTGRAFAVSMSFNSLGLPIGSALAGFVAVRSIEAVIAFGIVTSLIAGILAVVTIPSEND